MANAKYRYWLTKEGLLQIGAWARNGLTEEQIAHNMGIRRSTLFEWRKKYSDISDALKNNKAVVDIEVENALHKRALGFDTTEKITCIDADGNKTVKTVQKHIPGDVTAMIFWLKNRMKKDWRDKVEIEHSGQIDLAGTLQTAREQAAEMAKKAEEEAKK